MARPITVRSLPVRSDRDLSALRRTGEPTARELRAIRAVAVHGTTQAAAASLCVSRYTIDSQMDSLRAKTGLRFLPQLVAWAARRGFLEEAGEK